MRRGALGAAALLAVAAAGCAGTLPARPTPQLHQEVPPSVFLAASPFPALLVEVDWIDGREPDAGALDGLVRALREVCDKPAGVRLVVDDRIPADAWDERWGRVHWQETLSIADRWCSVEPRLGEARLYVLYVPSALQRPPQTAFASDTVPAVVIGTDLIDRGEVDERTELIHQTGHLLGLVNADGHETEHHCTDGGCVMTERARATSFCADCRADLERARSLSCGAVAFTRAGVDRWPDPGGYRVNVRFRSAAYRLSPTDGETPAYFAAALGDPSIFVRGLAARAALGAASRSPEVMGLLAATIARERSDYVCDASLPTVALALRRANDDHARGGIDAATLEAIYAKLTAPEVMDGLRRHAREGQESARTSAIVILGELEARGGR